MSLDDLVQVNISSASATPTEPGFGTILIAAQKVPVGFPRTRLFSSLTEMVDAGFSVSDPAYLCAQKIKAQNPSVEGWKVGKRANKLAQTIKLTCLSATEGDIYKITINGTAITYTVLAAATTTTVATAIELLVEAVTGIASTSSAADITVTHATGAGELFDVKDWSDNFRLQDMTSDPGGSTGLAADLAAIKAYDNDWYGLALDSNSEAEINIAAPFVETEKKLFVPNTSDTLCGDAGTATDIMSDIKTAAYARTGVLWSKKQLLSYSGAAWMAKQFTQDPGSDTWKFKTLASVNADVVSGAERSAILAKNGNFYSAVSGVNITEDGKSGAGEWLDVTRFVDWLRARIQFLTYSAFVNNAKIPFTDKGIELVGAIVKSALVQGEKAGGLAEGSSTVTIPKASSISSADKALRKLTGMKFSGTLAGAVHELKIDGSISA